MKTIIALYDRLSDAENVLRELQDAGLPPDRANVVAAIDDDTCARYFDDTGRCRPELLRNAAGGEADSAFALGSLLTGIGMFALPAVGPILAAGPLLGALPAAASSASHKGLVDLLESAGVPRPDAEIFEEGAMQGAVLLLLTAGDDEADTLQAVLGRHNPVDVAERSRQWGEAVERRHAHRPAVS